MGDGPDIKRRAPDIVMRLKRLGSLHQSRLSFMRILTRRLARDAWRFEPRAFQMDRGGVGHAVYTAHGPDRAYSLVAFAHDLPDDQRSDRVIAEAWDATFTLFDGIPTAQDIARLAKNVPLQETGRVSETELTLSRANRSVRLWAHVIERLAAGLQPDPQMIESVGYLMRTTAVYGSGKFGAADRAMIADRPEMHVPFQAEMLSVYLIRWFVRDLVQHMADARGAGKTAKLAPDIARRLGIGNSTGLGMAPFLINHPVLLNNWISVREDAIAQVRALAQATPGEADVFRDIFRRAKASVAVWRSDHPIQIEKLASLRADLAALSGKLRQTNFARSHPWDHLMRWAEDTLSEEGQEFLASLILEPYGALVDHLANHMASDAPEPARIKGTMPIARVRALVRQNFGWSEDLDWSAKEHTARAWYVSEEKLEPRLGERFDEPIAAYEQPLAPARDAIAALKALKPWEDTATIAAFLLRHPEHRHIIRRVQMTRHAPYAEIRDNTIGAEVLPIDMLRAKLSFFGATHFDPRSDRWVRICMFAGAPYPDDLTDKTSDLWVYPETPA
jgi:hypothetical protein